MKNKKRDNKQCRVTVNKKRLISKRKKSEKNRHIYKSHDIIWFKQYLLKKDIHTAYTSTWHNEEDFNESLGLI